MALAVSYADRTEIIDGLSSASGLEYTLTQTMSRLISTTSALAGLEGQAKLTLYLTKELEKFNINGLKNLEKTVMQAYKKVNSENMDRIDFETVDPPQEQILELTDFVR